MSTKVTIRKRMPDGSKPGFRLYHDVLDEFGDDDQGSLPIHLQLIGVQAQLETMVTGGVDVHLTLPLALAKELGLMSSPFNSLQPPSERLLTEALARPRVERTSGERWVLQPVDVGTGLDNGVRAYAKRQDICKGEAFHRFVAEGLTQLVESPLKRPRHETRRLHRRWVNLPASLLEEISGLSVTNRLTKSEVLRQLAKIGMKALRQST